MTKKTENIEFENSEDMHVLVRYTQNLRVLINFAVYLALLDNKKRVSLTHLFYAFLFYPSALQKVISAKLKPNVKAVLALEPKLFERVNKEMEEKGVETFVKEVIEKTNKIINNDKLAQNVVLSTDVKQAFEVALRFARRSGSYYIGLEHVFAGLLVVAHDKPVEKFKDILVSFSPIKEFIVEILDSHKKILELFNQTKSDKLLKPISSAINAGDQYNLPESNFLYRYSVDLVQYLKSNLPSTDLIAPRLKYRASIASHLDSTTYHNVLLVGDHGVGKTFAVYDLAMQLAEKNTMFAENIKEIRVINFPEIVATAKFGVEVEKRFLGVLNDLYGKTDTILFLDDIHKLIAPPARGGMNLGHVLKDFLRSTNVRIIAGIPTQDYEAMHQYYADVFNFFHNINITEPEESVVQDILLRHMSVYIQKFQFFETESLDNYVSAIKSIITLSKEYILDGVLPNKAVKVLEGVISKKRLMAIKEFTDLNKLSEQYEDLENVLQHYLDLGDFSKAQKVEKNIMSVEKKENVLYQKAVKKMEITVQDVYDYVAEKTKLPIKLLDKAELTTLKELEDALKKHIYSQDHAINAVAYAVKRGRLGIVDKDRPWASFLFLGPTGVGKTGLAKALASVLFGDEKEHLIQLDMSEFMEKHSISKLIGSPPGYVGFEEGGYLTERIKKTPFAVVLFDEIEKASNDVLNLLLQILEDGRLTDSHGETVSFRHTIIILTSNIGADKLFAEKVSGFVKQGDSMASNYDEIKEILLKQLKKKLRPELINRLDDVVVFNALSKQDASNILNSILEQLNTNLITYNVEITLSAKAKNYLIDLGFTPEYGARALRRIVQNKVENILADYMLTTGLKRYTKKKQKTKLVIDFDSKTKKLVIKDKNK